MIGAFFLLVYCVKLYKDLDALEREYGATYLLVEAPKTGTRTPPPKVTFTGYLGRLVNPTTGQPSWFQSTFSPEEYSKLMRDLSDVPTFSRIGFLKRRLEQYYKDQQKKSGFYSEFRVESGLAVLNRAAEILDQIGPQLGRYLLTDLELSIPPQSNAPRHLTMKFALRNDARGTFREKYSALSQAFRDACQPETSPFEKINGSIPSEVESFKGDTGEGGYYMQIRVDLKQEMPVFHTNRGV
jgi:hypothetical protein